VNADREWRELLAARPETSAGFTLRVLTALPPVRPHRERLRIRVLLLAVVLAALVVAALAAPAALTLDAPPRLAVLLVACALLAALLFWSVLTVAD
jgi:hypothetical protein